MKVKALEKKVKSGVRWLNKVKPNWYKKIDLETLDLSDNHVCVCGQVFGDYWKVILECDDGEAKEGRKYTMTERQAIARGYNLDSAIDFDLLTRVWYLEVMKLQGN